MEILTVENLSFSYPLSGKKSLQNVSFSVEEGDFVTIIGATGSGKSTLLRLMKPQVAPKGEVTGEIRFGRDVLTDYRESEDPDTERRRAAEIGCVMQRPDEQIVTDKVWHELAFGLENLQYPQETIRRRVAEMAGYFGIENWFEKRTDELSGGQKQLLNLAAVMVMQPKLLLFDEPTAQLDPIAAADFIRTVAALNRDLGLTVIMVEHHLEEVLPVSNKIIALDHGCVVAAGETKAAVNQLIEKKSVEGLPAATRLFAEFSGPSEKIPLSVREGRQYLRDRFPRWIYELQVDDEPQEEKTALEFSNVFFRYRRELPDVLKGLSLRVSEGEIFCLLGGNGSGKSTALSLAAALRRPYAGTIRVFGKKLKDYKTQELYRNCLAMLPQDVQTVFLKNTVREELEDAGFDETSVAGLISGKQEESKEGSQRSIPDIFTDLLDQHPYDLSGGQQQLLALTKALAGNPKLLLLDEPTKGLDAGTKNQLIQVLKELKAKGMTIVCVTHDVEFAAKAADRCGLLFAGEVVSTGVPRRFFPENAFYTTAASRIARDRYENIATVDDLIEICRQNRDAESYL